MTPDPLLDYADWRAYTLNLASAWGSDPDGVLINLLLDRIGKLQQQIDEQRKHNL